MGGLGEMPLQPWQPQTGGKGRERGNAKEIREKKQQRCGDGDEEVEGKQEVERETGRGREKKSKAEEEEGGEEEAFQLP